MHSSTIEIQLRISAGASRTEIRGWHGDALKISVTTAPEKGKANAAIIQLLARALNVPKSKVRIIRGESQPDKRVSIEGIDPTTLTRILGKPP